MSRMIFVFSPCYMGKKICTDVYSITEKKAAEKKPQQRQNHKSQHWRLVAVKQNLRYFKIPCLYYSNSHFQFCLMCLSVQFLHTHNVLSELSTMAHPSRMTLHGMAHSFIELDKAVVHVIRLFSFLWLWFSVWWLSLWQRRIRGLRKLPDGRDWLGGNWVLFWWVGPCSESL